MEKKILLTGGGSGGHVFPLIAVIQELKNAAKEKKINIKLQYLGIRETYNDYIKKEGVGVYLILSSKLRRYFSVENFIDIPKFFLSLIQAIVKVAWLRPQVVFSKGGSGALAVVWACNLLKVPVIIHETDSVPGMTNRLSGKKAAKVLLAFEKAKKFFINKKTIVIGNPIRNEILSYANYDPDLIKESLNIDDQGLPLLLILGGSSGSERINYFILNNLNELLKRAVVIHQTGVNSFNEFKTLNIKNYHPVAFLEDDYGKFLAAVDLVISRSGGTIFDIAAFGKPAILIPLTESANNHQQLNAEDYGKNGAAVIIKESELLANIFFEKLDNVLKPKELKKMAAAARKFSKLDAARKAAEEILSFTTKIPNNKSPIN